LRTKLAVHRDHLVCDENGDYPAEFNQWEIAVLKAEMHRPGFKSWYRNPNRPSQDSLGVAYVDGDETKIVRPDFLFFAESRGEMAIDIVDPRGIHLNDALPKLQGLARYAQTHAKIYRRIASVAEVGGKLRVLELSRAAVSEAVLKAGDAKSLYGGPLAGDYA
jgi:type III restriction enzyme